MSAPERARTTDGMVWERRAETRGGLALYAVEGAPKCCPPFVMATLEELAEHGVQSAELADAVAALGALPMPAGPASTARDQLRAAYVAALETAHKTQPCSCGSEIWSSCYHPERPGRTHYERRADAVLAVRDVEMERLTARVAELEAERHVTNEALDDSEQALRLRNTQRGDVERLVEEAEQCGDDCVDVGELVTALALGTDDERAESGRSVEVSADPLTALLAPTQALREDEPAAKCRCDEPDADPYSCEADGCSGHFSELNPFGGARPVDVPSAEVSRTCSTCGWRTTVWHVDDGSAEAELHDHVTRVHGGTVPAETGGA